MTVLCVAEVVSVDKIYDNPRLINMLMWAEKRMPPSNYYYLMF